VEQRRADDVHASQKYRDGVNIGINTAVALLRGHVLSVDAHLRAQGTSDVELALLKTFVAGAATLIEAEKLEAKDV
jgi:hypothetical protein